MSLLSNIFGEKNHNRNIKSPFPETGFVFDIGILQSSDFQHDLTNRANKILNYLGRSGSLVMVVVESSLGHWGSTPHECRNSAMNALIEQLVVNESEAVVGYVAISGAKGIQETDPNTHVKIRQDVEDIRKATESKNIRFLLGSLGHSNKFIAALILK